MAIYLPWKPSAGDISLESAVEATLANLCVDVPSERNKEILARASCALWFFISRFMFSRGGCTSHQRLISIQLRSISNDVCISC